MTNSRFGQELYLSGAAPVMFAPTLIFPTSIHPNAGIISQNGTKKTKQGVWQTLNTYSYYERVCKHYTIHKMSSSKEAHQIACCVLFFLSLSLCWCLGVRYIPSLSFSWGGSLIVFSL